MFKILKKQNGQVLALVALGAAVLIGTAALVIDVGYMSITKSQLQAAADQAALAGCNDLNIADPSVTVAAADATTYAGLAPGKSCVLSPTNPNPDITPVVVVSPADGVFTSDVVRTVKVTTGRVIKPVFASIFGIGPLTVTATATAEVFPAASIPPSSPPDCILEPTGIQWTGGTSGVAYSQEYTKEITPSGSNSFTYVDVWFDSTNPLEDNGAYPQDPNCYNAYINALTYGDPNPLTVNSPLYYIGPAEGGEAAINAMAGRLLTSVGGTLSSYPPGTNTDITQAQAGDPQLMLVATVAAFPTNSQGQPLGQQTTTTLTNTMQITGFVGFWLDSIHLGTLKNGCYPDYYATGRFVQVALPANTPAVPGSPWLGTGQVQLVN